MSITKLQFKSIENFLKLRKSIEKKFRHNLKKLQREKNKAEFF